MGGNFCALECNPSDPASQCGRDASCKPVSGSGVCTYDAMRGAPAAAADLVVRSAAADEIASNRDQDYVKVQATAKVLGNTASDADA